jgi:hypothetical protein
MSFLSVVRIITTLKKPAGHFVKSLIDMIYYPKGVSRAYIRVYHVLIFEWRYGFGNNVEHNRSVKRTFGVCWVRLSCVA